MSRVAPRDSAAQAASAVAESVRYQGRKASRQGSEQRRQAILDAAMRLIVRDGVRAVRHRAVAAEAQVPLSATTYYFKDIDDLITDTFALFVERNAEALSAFWSSVEGDLQEMAAVLADDPGARGSLVERIVELAVQYVQVQPPSAASTCWPNRPSARRRCSTRACANWPMPTSGFSPSAPCISSRCSVPGSPSRTPRC